MNRYYAICEAVSQSTVELALGTIHLPIFLAEIAIQEIWYMTTFVFYSKIEKNAYTAQ